MEHNKLSSLIAEISSKLCEPLFDHQSMNRWKTEMISLIDTIAEFKLCYPMNYAEEDSSLDPVDWTSARCLSHKILDSSLDYTQHIRNAPVWKPIPNDVRLAIMSEKVPEQGQSLLDVYHNTLNYVVPYALGYSHPRFWGWVSGEGTLGGTLADIIASTLNVNCAIPNQSGSIIERIVIKWMRQIFGYPEVENGGLLVSGTSMGTVLCMAAARQQALINVRQEGLAQSPQLVAYASTEVHGCVSRALELLGIGSKSLRRIPVDDNFTINIDILKRTIQDDRDQNLIPFCIIGNAGTVNTGAFDNLLELSLIARAEHMWFHVDGAFGSFIILDPQRRHFVKGIDQADSIAFDFHKWLHCPYDAGCALVRDGGVLQSTFSAHYSYLSTKKRASVNDEMPFYNLGIEFSRPFRALKVWFTLKEYGMVKLGQNIAKNCEQAQYLVSLLEKHGSVIRIIRPVLLSVVNFRFEPKEFANFDPKLIDTFNNELVEDLQISGIAFPSTTTIQNRLYIRICIVSHRSVLADFDLFLEHLLTLYRKRLQSYIKQRRYQKDSLCSKL